MLRSPTLMLGVLLGVLGAALSSSLTACVASNDAAAVGQLLAVDPSEGRACPVVGQSQPCGIEQVKTKDYVVCGQGERACGADGRWGVCVPTGVTAKVARSVGGGGISLQGLGAAISCNSVCDPQCMVYPDDPAGLDAGPGFVATDGGLALAGGDGGPVGPSCSLSVLPVVAPVAPVVVTSIDGSGNVLASTGNHQRFRAYEDCGSGPIQVTPTWSTDAPDRVAVAAVGMEGDLNVIDGIGVPVRVVASFGGNAASLLVPIRVLLPNEKPVSTNGLTAPQNPADFASADATRAVDPGKTLYPYSGTLFPTGMAPPVVQWTKAGVSASSVRVTLRFTPTASAADAFTWTTIFREPNQGRALTAINDGDSAVDDFPATFSKSSGGSLRQKVYDFTARNVIPQNVWAAFEQTARPFAVAGVATNPGVASIVLERYSGGAPRKSKSINVEFADGTLRGNVLFTEYSDNMTPGIQSNDRARLVAGDGRTGLYKNAVPETPTNKRCPTCHSASADGSTVMIGSGNNSRSFGDSMSVMGSLDSTSTFVADPLPASLSFTYRLYNSGSINRAYASLLGSQDQVLAISSTSETDKFILRDADLEDYTWSALSPNGKFGLLAENYWGNTMGPSGGEGMPTDTTTWFGSGDITTSNQAIRPYDQVTAGRYTGMLIGNMGLAGRNRWNRTPYRVYRISGTPGSRTNSFLDSDAAYANGGLGSASMMTPTFSPDGKKLAFVNGDMAADSTPGAYRSGWRRGISTFDITYDGSGRPLFANRKLAYDNFKNDPDQMAWPGSTMGATRPEVIWPTFESDSRMVLFQGVEASPAFAAHSYSGAAPYAQYEYCGSGTPAPWFGDARRYGFPGVASPFTPCANDPKYGAYNQFNAWAVRGGVAPGQQGGLWRADTQSASPFDAAARMTRASDGQGEPDEFRTVAQPTALPSTVGGKHWVVFTSRRPYGNIKNAGGLREPPADMDTTSQSLLWVAAIDEDPDLSRDASHPAFLFPAQRISYSSLTSAQGVYPITNERGFWVRNQCTPTVSGPPAVANECQSSDDCCLGSQCVIEPASSPLKKYCRPKPAVCIASGLSGCAVDADCCGGATCNAGTCGVVPTCSPYSDASFTRDFQSGCGTGEAPIWTLFETQTVIPAGTSVRVYVRAADTAAGLASAPEVQLNTIVAGASAWGVPSNSFDVNPKVVASYGRSDARHLRIRMELRASADRCSTPTVKLWRQLYTCKDDQ